MKLRLTHHVLQNTSTYVEYHLDICRASRCSRWSIPK